MQEGEGKMQLCVVYYAVEEHGSKAVVFLRMNLQLMDTTQYN